MQRVVSLQGPSGDWLYTLVCGLEDTSEKRESSVGDSYQHERLRWFRQMTREATGNSGSGDCDHWVPGYLEGPSLSVLPPAVRDPVQRGCCGMGFPLCYNTVLVRMCMLLATSPQGEHQAPMQAARACFSVVPWVLQHGPGPPHLLLLVWAYWCLKAGNKTPLGVFSLVEKGQGRAIPASPIKSA